MTKVLVASFDMEIGGVEKSLISMLSHFDYKNYHIDLMLYRHAGDLLNHLPPQVNLLPEHKLYRTFRMSVREMFQKGHIVLGTIRLYAKIKATLFKSTKNSYKQMQYMWKYSLPFLPRVKKTYDVAVSYLWPHYFVAEKIKAKIKIAWIHTDYSKLDTDIKIDVAMWQQFDYLIAVSDECKQTFIKKYPSLTKKVFVIENITSPDFIREQAEESVANQLIDDKRFKLVTVARLSYAKGIDQAVKALHILKQQGLTEIVWYVIGYGGDEHKIRQLISDYKVKEQFILLGKKINPYPFMKAADLYVQPSRYEGKAVTVGEAQILGKPVLITHYPTAKSQITDEKDGVICPLSVDGIAAGIKKLYGNPSLREELSTFCEQSSYSNKEELIKLYELMSGGTVASCRKKK